MENMLQWFEIPVGDLARAKAFYESVFQLEMQDMQIDKNRLSMFPAEGISGALWEEEGYQGPERGTRVYLTATENIDNILKRVEANGGQIYVPRTQVTEEIGWSGMFIDPDGNRVGLFEPA